MDSAEEENGGGEVRHVSLKADEVDTGTKMLSPSQQAPLSAPNPTNSSSPTGPRPKAPTRPFLRREGSAVPPPAPSLPPPAPPFHADPENLTDSLSLPQLKQLVAQFPKLEQRAYAFQYADAQDFATEVNEWFRYTEQDGLNLLASRDVFEQLWKLFCKDRQSSPTPESSWIDVETSWRREFVLEVLTQLQGQDARICLEALGCICYIACGAWGLTGGLEIPGNEHATVTHKQVEFDCNHSIQIQWIHIGVDLLVECSVPAALLGCLRASSETPELDQNANIDGEDNGESLLAALQSQVSFLSMTSLYLIVESSRSRSASDAGEKARHALAEAKPNGLVVLVDIISPSRWEASNSTPVSHALHLFWKTLLLLFGNVTYDLHQAQGLLQPRIDPFSPQASHPVLTASPLDYHLFRQEITSKYPAYNPPLPLIPVELEHKSMQPALPHHPIRPDAIGGAIPGPKLDGANGSASIFHQPVHIATPAPSPPPSPVGPGGKQGKKQNYQTNQNFPFLYPPLDESSNEIGGRGVTQMQDLMVGKKWEGSDVPTSIIEAGELFASRMRMTRAMRQLWNERDSFMTYNRGWKGVEKGKGEPVTLDDDENDERPPARPSLDPEEDPNISKVANLKDRLEAVDDFFHHSLPNLQSLVIVMMKLMLRNVQDIALQNGSLQENNAGGLHRSKSNANMAQNQSLPMPPPPIQPTELDVEELDNIRSREISQKAIAGALFLLLKWFKLSHVLKFEYMTQLLLDSNYLQLTLKYFAHQNLEDMVAVKYDRDDLSFFHFCHLNSDHPPLSPTSPQPESDVSDSDDAIPPPILRLRRSPTSSSEPIAEQTTSPGQIGEADPTIRADISTVRPSVDELGNPIAPLPSSPITEFSFRQFQTSIHLLRILQKVTRAKAHRILLLVQFKSSQILKRILRVPDQMLRRYVLKLFKSQVPYCGRKWRQSNMRVITAIYLECRPDLRDEWLAGMHDSAVEGEVDEAVPLEWALRGLTYWWQKRTYPDMMKLRHKTGNEDMGQEIEDDERDFFQKELDNMGWGVAGLSVEEEVAFGEEAPGANGNGPNGGEQWESAMNLEGWE